jgi:hypothetical protein
MLAEVLVKLPFDLLVPEGERFNVTTYNVDGYEVQIGLPVSSDRPSPLGDDATAELDGRSAFYADCMAMTFRQPEFDRGVEGCDPPYDVINSVIRSHVERLRFVCRAPDIAPVELPNATWKLRYLSDDGSELPPQDDRVRGRGGVGFDFRFIACNAAVWDHVHALDADFKAPEWRRLLTDAHGALPHIGAAIVLAATALEIFIAGINNKLAARSAIPPALWEWVTDRQNHLSDPSVEEQFSVLVKVLCGHSLKEDGAKWEAFKNLKTARNKFAHEGVARIGREPVDLPTALRLLEAAEDIVVTVRDWLPADLQWPVYAHTLNIRFRKKLLPGTEEGDNSA